MRLRWATIAAAVTGLAVIAPAQAREEAITGVATTPGIGPQGFRVAEASNGFQLVEHGIWKRPKDTTLPAAAIVEAGRIHLPLSP